MVGAAAVVGTAGVCEVGAVLGAEVVTEADVIVP